MKVTVTARFVTLLTLALALGMFSGCIKRVSGPVIEEADFWPVTQKITLSNPMGKAVIAGDGARLFNAHLRVEKSVQTSSLLGLANPDKYQDFVEVYQGVNNGDLNIGVSVRRLSFFERLFVKVSPKIEFILDSPLALSADIEVTMGNIEISNMVGDINAAVNVGEMKVTSTLGVYGSQNFDLNIGSLDIRLPADMPIRYDLETNIGKIESAGFDAEIERRLLGARTTGVKGTTVTPSYVRGRVSIGNINFQGE